jgi:hypothetical protein
MSNGFKFYNAKGTTDNKKPKNGEGEIDFIDYWKMKWTYDDCCVEGCDYKKKA